MFSCVFAWRGLLFAIVPSGRFIFLIVSDTLLRAVTDVLLEFFSASCLLGLPNRLGTSLCGLLSSLSRRFFSRLESRRKQAVHPKADGTPPDRAGVSGLLQIWSKLLIGGDSFVF